MAFIVCIEVIDDADAGSPDVDNAYVKVHMVPIPRAVSEALCAAMGRYLGEEGRYLGDTVDRGIRACLRDQGRRADSAALRGVARYAYSVMYLTFLPWDVRKMFGVHKRKRCDGCMWSSGYIWALDVVEDEIQPVCFNCMVDDIKTAHDLGTWGTRLRL